MRGTIPKRENIDPDTPLRLGIAAAVAFPDGSMTASGLRRESTRGRLIIERIAGKDFTTLANIERMRQLCRVPEKAPGCGFVLPAARTAVQSRMPSGSSVTEGAISPRDALRTRLAKLRAQ